MKHTKTITILTVLTALLAAIASATGIFYNQRGSSYEFTSIHGKEVIIYGKGLYKHMSAEVAPQGIAQDYITLFVAVPLLFISIFMVKKKSLKGRYLLAGTFGYILVTYLFYLTMAIYNALFLVYIALAGLSFFSLFVIVRTFNSDEVPALFKDRTPVKFAGGFLIFNAISIGFLWLSIVVPPLLNGTIIPVQVEHYTTLIVQGYDLALLLPAGAICGKLLYQKKPLGYLWAPIYFVFLSILMIALTAKIIAMHSLGYSVVPVIFIIPCFAIISIICTYLLLKNVR